MSIYVNILSVVLGVFIIFIIFRNMVRKKINERQGLFWLLIGCGGVILGVWPNLLQRIASAVGIWYPPAILFAVAFAGLILITFYHTIIISVMNNKVQELTMQIVLMKSELDELKNNIEK